MRLNGYSWVAGNTPNRVDPTGLFDESSCTIEYGDYLERIAIQVGVILDDGTPLSAIPNPTLRQRREGWEKIARLNPQITNPNVIFPGERLRALPLNARGVTCGTSGTSPSTKSCGYVPIPTPPTPTPVPPTPTPVPPSLLTLGTRLLDFTAIMGVAGVDINLELHFAPYYLFGGGNRTAWFLNASIECNTDITAINASVGAVLGRIGWPSDPGDTTFVNTVGGGGNTPWLELGLEGDATWSSETGDFILYLGAGGGFSVTGSPVSGFVSRGASVYLGTDLANIPEEAWRAIREVGQGLANQPYCA